MRAFQRRESNWRLHQENNLTERSERKADISGCLVINLDCAYLSLQLGVLPVLPQISSNAVCVQRSPTFARVDCTELSLHHPIWAGDVAPGPLGGVWVSAVIVISNTYRRDDKSSTRLLLKPLGNTGLSLANPLDSLIINTNAEKKPFNTTNRQISGTVAQ